jgi:hypothetical protein
MNTEQAILDGNGDPVTLTDEMTVMPREVLAQFFAGRVPATECPHYIAASEARAGFEKCERC